MKTKRKRKNGRSRKEMDARLFFDFFVKGRCICFRKNGCKTYYHTPRFAQAPLTTRSFPMDTLSPDQALVARRFADGSSFFFTGAAGTGKSHLLRHLIEFAKKTHRNHADVCVTASTGIAACNIGGTTVHSFAGIGLGKEDVPTLLEKIRRNSYQLERWRSVQVLFIDEIGMIDGRLFDKLECLARSLRLNGAPFGGIQVITCGDFFQLPPITEPGQVPIFAFEATSWRTVIRHSFTLTTQFRQHGDSALAGILNSLRRGVLTPEAASILQTLDIYRGQSRPVSLRRDLPVVTSPVYYIHRIRLLLCTRALVLGGRATASVSTAPSPSFSWLCSAAPMWAVSLVCGLLHEDHGKPVVLFPRNIEVDAINREELSKLSTKLYTFVAVDEGNSKQLLSQISKHCTAPGCLELKVGATVMLLVNLGVSEGLFNGLTGTVEDIGGSGNGTRVCVKFIVHGDKPVTIGITPHTWRVSNGKEYAYRIQIPLKLAYAITDHKSQGLSLKRAHVKLSGTFEFGQAYVALSRATSLDGLTIEGFSDRVFRAHPKVLAEFPA